VTGDRPGAQHAALPSLFGKIGFDKVAPGDLFLVMNFAMLA
jgi:hypothetical protein